jgi:hypothetical protein
VIQRLLNILVVDSIRELIRYKSFFLLVTLLIGLDRWLKATLGGTPSWIKPGSREMSALAQWAFEDLPGLLLDLMLDWRTLAVLGVLFAFKELTSMWPSSDMRLIHRNEGGRWHLVSALQRIRWQQVAWDALAISTVVGGGIAWTGMGYVVGWTWWQQSGNAWALLAPGAMAALYWPLGMAGFSYSSKLAVLQQPSFEHKRFLLSRLFLDSRVRTWSWVFYLVRLVLSAVFVIIIPVGAMLTLENSVLRIFVAAASSAPVYSYVKMASFKFFLEVYRPYPEVRAEYAQYYKRVAAVEE